MKYFKPAVYLDAIKFIYSDQGINELKEFCQRFEAEAKTIVKARTPGAKAKAVIVMKRSEITLSEGEYLFMHKDNVLGRMNAEHFELMYTPIEEQ